MKTAVLLMLYTEASATSYFVFFGQSFGKDFGLNAAKEIRAGMESHGKEAAKELGLPIVAKEIRAGMESHGKEAAKEIRAGMESHGKEFGKELGLPIVAKEIRAGMESLGKHGKEFGFYLLSTIVFTTFCVCFTFIYIYSINTKKGNDETKATN